MDLTKLELGHLLSAVDPVIKRHADGILKQLRTNGGQKKDRCWWCKSQGYTYCPHND